jgi:hypothetical protein
MVSSSPDRVKPKTIKLVSAKHPALRRKGKSLLAHHIQNIGDKVCNFLVAGRCISHGTLFSSFNKGRGRRDRDRIVVGFTATCEISAHHH